jgi:hypothetical protein
VPSFKVSRVNDLAFPLDATNVRHQVMTAGAMAAQALTDTEQPPDGRLQSLIEAHGQILAARGPGSPLTFSAFRDLLTEDLALLLPDGVPAEEMQGVHLITPDGQFDDDLYDLEQEQRLVLRALAKATRGGRPASSALLESEMDQERVYAALKKRLDQRAYVDGRKALIETPAGSDSKLRKLRLPSSVADFYRPIVHAAIYDRWWFACPICRWPMKITIRRSRGTKTGTARCFHRPHTELGAAYHFKIADGGRPPSLVPAASAPPRPAGDASVLFADVRGHGPEPIPVEGHKALTRGVWRWTTIPGLVEVALYQALDSRGLKPLLWPDLDAYDVHVEVGTGTRKRTFRIDLKDYTSPVLLARKIQADGGDAGGAQWLVLPDYRAPSVPLLTTVCREFGLNVATAGQIGALACQAAGVPWA